MGQNSSSQEGGAKAAGKPRTLRIVLLILVIIAVLILLAVRKGKTKVAAPQRRTPASKVVAPRGGQPGPPEGLPSGLTEAPAEAPAEAPDSPETPAETPDLDSTAPPELRTEPPEGAP